MIRVSRAGCRACRAWAWARVSRHPAGAVEGAPQQHLDVGVGAPDLVGGSS
jgi:hypothetical protein